MRELKNVCHVLCFLTALKQLHGADKYHGEKADIEKERLDAVGVKPKKPWELFSDRSLRRQLVTIILINIFQQLNGINAVRVRQYFCPIMFVIFWHSPGKVVWAIITKVILLCSHDTAVSLTD